MDTLNHQRDEHVGPKANSVWNIAGGKNDKAVLLTGTLWEGKAL